MTSFNISFTWPNVLLLMGYNVRDILWLRLFAVAAALISLPYFVLQPTPQWAPIAWSVVFAGINSFQSWRLYFERRPVKLTPDEAGSRSRNCRLARFFNLSASGPGPQPLPANV